MSYYTFRCNVFAVKSICFVLKSFRLTLQGEWDWPSYNDFSHSEYYHNVI